MFFSDYILTQDESLWILFCSTVQFHFTTNQKEGLPSPDEIKHIRKQFKLSQVEAGKLIGGGTRAFQKYESGDVLPSRTLANLLAVLARDSNVINILRDIADFRQKCSVKE